MLAARLYGPRKLVVEEIEKPVINDNEILLKIKSAAVCGTDIRMYQNGYGDISESNPRVLGHEFGGVIEKAGKNVEYYREGMEVALAPNIGCGICDKCVRGNGHLCDHYTAFGINMDGAFAEYVKVPEKAIRQGNLMEIPAGLKAEDVALNEPLSCAYNGSLQCSIVPGDYVLIIGAGTIGLFHAKLAKIFGAARIFMNDLSADRLQLCREIESSIIPYHGNDIDGFIKKQTKGRGVDVCITACPSPEDQKKSLELMAEGGRINFFGGLPKSKENVMINTNIIHYKQLIVTGTTRANIAHFRKTLGFIADGLIDLTGIVTARYGIRDIGKAFDNAEKAIGLKNVIEF
jgi:L-iditol 2-dehydrogenase